MICPDCSAINDDSAQTCSSCGRSLLHVEPALIEESPPESMQSGLELLWQNWSKMALGSLALIIIAWLLVRNVFVSDFIPFLLLALIATGLSIACGRNALAERDYIQRNKANFWIVVISMSMAYFLIMFFVVMLFGFLDTLANWE